MTAAAELLQDWWFVALLIEWPPVLMQLRLLMLLSF
jgi:hypothetical protein